MRPLRAQRVSDPPPVHLQQSAVPGAVPSWWERIVLALAISAFSLLLFAGFSGSPTYRSDLDQLWHAGRALIEGRDPYAMDAAGLRYWGFPLYYPLPAIVTMIPLALLPLTVARWVFVGVSAGLLAYAATREGRHRLWIFLSGAFVASVGTVQWAPLLTAAFLLPWLAPVIFVKPNIGLVLAAATPERRFYAAALIGGGLLLLVSFVLDPRWVARWLNAVQNAPHFTPPVLLWGGASNLALAAPLAAARSAASGWVSVRSAHNAYI